MIKDLFPHKIIWLASYPKSGNTWFRAFLTALLNNGEVQINDMEADAIFASREIFEAFTDIDSRDLYQDEVRLMLPEVYRQMAEERRQTTIVKVHDAYSFNKEKDPIIPEEVTHCAIYIIRNPLDVVGSFANHNKTTIEQAIQMMCNAKGYLANQKSNRNVSNQLPQLMYDWSAHVRSWVSLPSFPVYIVRYEDMLQDSFDTFKSITEKIGWHFTDEEISAAIEASSFEQLKQQEQDKGFQEKKVDVTFFRAGTMRNWEKELNEQQIETIINHHRAEMENYGYYPY